VLLPLRVPPYYDAGDATAPESKADDESERIEEKKSSSPRAKRVLTDRMLEGGRRMWNGMEERLDKVDKVLTQFAAELKRMVEELMDGVFPASAPFSSAPFPASFSQLPRRSSSQEEKKSEKQAERVCDVRRACIIPAARGQADKLTVPVVEEPSPKREVMGNVGAVADVAQWDGEVRVIGEMGLIHSAVDEETVRGLLQASRGDVAQCVQWMVDRLEMGRE